MSLSLLRTGLFLLLASGIGASASACSSSTASTPTEAPDVTTPDGGASEDAGAVTPSTTGPLSGKQGSWTWNPTDGMKCGNGSATGVGVNLGTSDRLVVFFEGGGACWNGLTCFAAKTATFLDGFGESEFQTYVVNGSRNAGSIFDRSSAQNPFKDDTLVYIPYCTGDVHAGSKQQTFDTNPTVYFAGLTNTQKALERITATWKDKAKRVVVSGSSAGGFGAAIHYERFAQAFAGARVDLLDDSGPPIPAAKSLYLQQWAEAWDLYKAFPEGCTNCQNDPANIVPYYSTKYASSRFALLSYDHDGTISKFYGLNGDDFKVAIEQIASGQFGPLANARTFLVPGTSHTMLGKLDTTSSGVVLGTWITQMLSDSPDWKSVDVTATP